MTHGTDFTLGDGRTTRLCGVNCYYLGFVSTRMVDATLDAACVLGANTVRTWAFLDDEPHNGVVYQTWDGEGASYNEAGLARLDFVIAAAAARGLRLILPLVNNWPDFGGIPAYQRWLGLATHQDFYSDPRARAVYRDWVRHLLTRTNSITGLAYRDEPAIAAWELTNEARCDGDPPRLRRWMDEMSRFVKSIDPNHLVAAGDEGFFNRLWPFDERYNGTHGADFDQFLQLDAIDFGTMHLYPWKQPDARYGCAWIERHASAAAGWSKPVVLAEYGWDDPPRREEIYGAWLETVRNTNIAGDLAWMLATANDDGTPYFDDGFTLYPATVPNTIREHARWSASRSSSLL